MFNRWIFGCAHHSDHQDEDLHSEELRQLQPQAKTTVSSIAIELSLLPKANKDCVFQGIHMCISLFIMLEHAC